MVMDARWKVYVQDRRFDDNQISNVYLKLKYETVGRFSFDFRPIDGDESYMVVNNTLRIFWGDLHKLDGVIQRVDWDAQQWCYHIYGADIRGLLLERVNTEPATVHSYTSDIQTSVMFDGCDFPTNVWTGSGENIGKYTFKYRVGIQNTIRVMGATRRWENVTERGTVYEHQNGCLYDATKNWVPQEYAGATLRFVSGACKNNVYNVNGNTTNRVCIRLPGESATLYPVTGVGGNVIRYGDFPTGSIEAPWEYGYNRYPLLGATVGIVSGGYGGGYCIYSSPRSNYTGPGLTALKQTIHVAAGPTLTVRYKYTIPAGHGGGVAVGVETTPGVINVYVISEIKYANSEAHNASWPDWDIGSVALTTTGTVNLHIGGYGENSSSDIWIDDVVFPPLSPTAEGTVPGCSRIGDIYEIVTWKMIEVQPPSIAPATLQQDNHIIHYNLTDDQSDHTTSITVRGTS